MGQLFVGIGIGLGTGNVKTLPPNAPVNTANPTISGNNTEGSTLTGTNGTWTGTAPITYEYQWERSGADIPGATAITHVVDALDVDHDLQLRVTATNVAGSDVAYSLPFNIPIPTPFGPKAPVLVTPVTVVGNPYVGSRLTGSDGDWDAFPDPEFTYRWFKNGAPIIGAVTNRYRIRPNDLGATLSYQVIATNPSGVAMSMFNGIYVLAPPAP